MTDCESSMLIPKFSDLASISSEGPISDSISEISSSPSLIICSGFGTLTFGTLIFWILCSLGTLGTLGTLILTTFITLKALI